MRSPLTVPLVLLTLTVFISFGKASKSSNISPFDNMKTAQGRSTTNEFITSDTKRVPDHGEVVSELFEKRVPGNGEQVKVTDEKMLKALETSLLSLFGLKKRPHPSGSVVIPEAIKELYRRQTGLEVETTNFHLPGRLTASANTVRTFPHTESSVDEQFRHHHRFRLSFALDKIPKTEKLQKAEVHLNAFGAHHILVHDIVRPGVKGKHPPAMRLIDSRHISASNGTITLDVTPAVSRWLRSPQENHGLLVVIQESNGRVRLKRDVERHSWKKVQPLLYTFTDDGKNKNRVPLNEREKRAVRKHKRKDGRDLCRRHELYVDFQEVGWTDWIVAPPGYDAYYCAGDCPFPQADHLNSTNHAIVQTLVNSVFPRTAPKACCVPTSLSSISMLYLDDEEKVVLKNYQDMTVIGCGCR